MVQQSQLITCAFKPQKKLIVSTDGSGEAVPGRCQDCLETFHKLDAEITANVSKCSKCGLCHTFRNLKTLHELQFLHGNVWFLHKYLNLLLCGLK